MTTMTFDTLKLANRLKAAGVPDKQAEAETEVFAEILAEAVRASELATKHDLAEAKSDIIKWVAGMLIAQAAVVATLIKLI